MVSQSREKDTKEKWEKTKMNQAVQQKKVASIVNQLQTTNSSSSSPTNLIASNQHQNQPSSLRRDSLERMKNMQNNADLVTFDDVRFDEIFYDNNFYFIPVLFSSSELDIFENVWKWSDYRSWFP